jgi:hypothetical protein
MHSTIWTISRTVLHNGGLKFRMSHEKNFESKVGESIQAVKIYTYHE